MFARVPSFELSDTRLGKGADMSVAQTWTAGCPPSRWGKSHHNTTWFTLHMPGFESHEGLSEESCAEIKTLTRESNGKRPRQG